MSETRVLDASIVKDLLNHIYEKRKATAFQIEGVTKSALARNDSATIYKIIAELTELANGGLTSAKMGAITALGSVSVALGTLAIAYFLEDIVKPIFATFRDTDARVRYYACESLYNIAKIARGEILLYFNEVFDILCILVTDTESLVKNAADILDRLIKDIVSAKSTSYVSILHQQNDEAAEIQSNIVTADGVAIQVNEPQDTLKAFLLPRFVPTLLERMYTIEPFAKKFLLSWLELFDDIPSSELITFLPNFLEPLIRFLMNNCPSDVRIETQNLLNTFLKEIRSIYKVKFEVRKNQIIKERKRKLAEALPKSDGAAQSTQAESEKGDTEKNGNTATALAADLNGIDLDAPDSDAISVKSTSTTIIRKADLKEGSAQDANAEDEEENSEFINGQDIFIDYPKIIDILLPFLRTGISRVTSEVKYFDLSAESHEVYLEIQTTVLKWLQEIIIISPTSFSKFIPECVSIIIQNVALTDSNNDIELRKHFLAFNHALQTYLIRLRVSNTEDEAATKATNSVTDVSESTIQGLNKDTYEEFLELYLNKTLQVVMGECTLSVNELARLTLLDWLTFLYANYRSSFFSLNPEEEVDEKSPLARKYNIDLTSLLRSSADASNEVISKVLSLAAHISEDNQDFFKDFIVKLILYFETDGPEFTKAPSIYNNGGGQPALSRSKVEFIIRKLCVSISSEKIFKTLSEVLVSFQDTNADFIGNIVVTLNNILLTTPELQDLRKKLKNLDIYKSEDWVLFSSLFQSWCHNAPSAISLCLLTSNYELSFLIIKNLAELEVTFQLLTQLDILVQLLESHIFLKLRLQLLEPEKYPYLYKTLYGILMIMPQSSTYTTLSNRLSSLTMFTQSGAQLLGALPSLTTPVSTPAASNTGTVASQLSTKRKRVHELADKFVKVNELHEKTTNERRQREIVVNDDIASVSGKVPPTLFPSSESKPFMQDYFSQSHKDKGKHRR